MRPDRDCLEDVLEAVRLIRERLPGTKEELGRSRLEQIWLVYHLQVIGEAVNNLSDRLVAAHPEVPWRQMAAMRNIVVHQNFGTELDTVWDTVTRDMPALEELVSAVLEDQP